VDKFRATGLSLLTPTWTLLVSLPPDIKMSTYGPDSYRE
jgi:hypothetical protein